MVTAAVVLTVAIDPKRLGAYRSGLRQESFPILAASFLNKQFFVLWVVGCIQCSKVQVGDRVERDVFALLLLHSRLNERVAPG